MLSLTLLTCLSLFCEIEALPVNTENNRPVIGILAQETEENDMKRFGDTYIPASYVKYLESGGSRVTPIRLNLTQQQYERIFWSINGLLFIGGAVDLEKSDYARAAQIFFRLALKANRQGDYFPLWGTCMGLQILTVMVAGENLLSNTSAENVALPLNLTKEARTSRMFWGFPVKMMKALIREPITGNFHHYGITLKTFKGNKKLQKFFTILSTNMAENGAEFVSTMEGRRYPIYGVQWHPEVNSFQWSPAMHFPHSQNAVFLSSLLAQFFVNEARKSMHHFPTLEGELSALIYNYNPLYIGNISSYEQCYFF